LYEDRVEVPDRGLDQMEGESGGLDVFAVVADEVVRSSSSAR
jgi:hypothetical protein